MASLPQNPAQLPSDGIALFATSSADGDCQNIPCSAVKSCLLARSISLPNCSLIVFRVAASSGSALAAGAAAVQSAAAVTMASSVLYMSEFPSRSDAFIGIAARLSRRALRDPLDTHTR